MRASRRRLGGNPARGFKPNGAKCCNHIIANGHDLSPEMVMVGRGGLMDTYATSQVEVAGDDGEEGADGEL